MINNKFQINYKIKSNKKHVGFLFVITIQLQLGCN